MKAKELRIGNYVLNDEGLLSIMCGFSPFGHSVRCDEEEGCEILIDIYPENGPTKIGYEIESQYIKPLPLTEEWLLKFGFEKINHIHGYSFHSLSKSKKNKCHIDIYDTQTKYMGYSVNHCQYVHQLQNLYFSLTGKELEMNKNK